MYASLTTFLQAHPTAVALGVYYVLSAAIGSLPMPTTASHMFYKWFFGFGNAIAANLSRAMASKIPATSSEEKKPN